MSGKDHISVRNKRINCSGGNCKSNNLIYGAQCRHCNATYVGKTTQELRKRIAQHRGHMKKLGTSTINVEVTDECTLAAHLKYDHDLTTSVDFNSSYMFTILKSVNNPGRLPFEEQRFINELDTLVPHGLNMENPVGVGINHL